MATYPDDAIPNSTIIEYAESFDVSGEETNPRAIFFKPDGTKMYITGTTGDDVNEYNLSSPWYVPSAVYSQNFDISGQETTPTGLFFKPDGTKMYILGNTGDDVNEYDLSSAWDVSTASYVQNFSVASEETAPTGLFFKPDGTKMYVVGTAGDDVNEYDLSSAWDVSTASYVQNFSVGGEETLPQAIFFKPDGTKMYIVGASGDDVNEYDLSTAWNVSTASYVQNFSVSSQDPDPTGLFFKPDGTKMYILGTGLSSVYEYTLGTPWRISTTPLYTFSSMVDRKPDRGYAYDREYNIIAFESEAGYERRSLRSRRPKRSYKLQYTNVSGLVRQAIENFYVARSGSLESFVLDLSHVGDSGTLYVRFDGALSITEVKSGLSTAENVYNISFNLVETYT